MSLDQITAQERASHFRKNTITYNFNIILQSEQYYGLAEIAFYLEDTKFIDLKLDFTGTLQSLNINSIDNPSIQTTSNFLIIPKKYLQKGRNTISILYLNKYDSDKLGCISFFDEEQNQYIYTQFEAYAAHRVVPCFDQPNLKAKMKLSVVAAKDWITVSNQPALSSAKFQHSKFKAETGLHRESLNIYLDKFLQNVGDDTNMTIFDYTQIMPTYIFGFASGPYTKVDPKSTTSVPKSIYGMKTSQQLLQSYAPFIFDISQKVMTFYQNFFQVKYPFKKYDQVFIRDHFYFAMQNAGMVTIDQYQTLKVNPTFDDYYFLAEVIAHQMAHHWFGDLVTIDWWDDLWLNESFAQYISGYALQKVNSQLLKPLNPAGIYFRRFKVDGYQADELNSATHPIKGDVPDTDVALSTFDPITYDKGAATIKQLMYLVSEASFSVAISKYFKTFAFSNATIDDFLNQFKPYFPTTVVDIDTWKNTWLLTPSLNVFQSIWDPTKQTTSQTLELYQSVYTPTFKTLRCHSMQLAFFDQTGAIVETSQVLVDPAVNPTLVSYDGSKNIAAVLVNFKDYTFIQNYIDYVSLSYFKANLYKISDDYTRSLIWFNISAMVRQSLIRVEQFAAIIQVQLFIQPLNFILNQMLSQLLYFLESYTDPITMIQLKNTIFDELYAQLQDPNLTSFDRIKTLSKYYISYAESDSQVLRLNDWLHGDDPNLIILPILDNELAWQIVKKVFAVKQQALSLDEKWKVFQYVYIGDSSSRAEEQKIVCDAIVSSLQGSYGQLYESLKVEQGPSTATRQLITEGLTNNFNYDLYYSTYRAKYFADIANEQVYKTLSYSNYQVFYQNMRPTGTDYDSQITEYQYVLTILTPIQSLAAHCTNINKIIDDLNLKKTNTTFNADSNLTLTKIRAEQRSQYIVSQSIKYNSHIGYTKLDSQSPATYTGFTQLTFSLSSFPKLLPLDFKSSNVKSININGYNIIPEPAQNDYFIVIPRVYLQTDNTIAVSYENQYNNDCEGCMAFIDDSVNPPQHYTYTNFEPHGAHLFFPCFDQPDLKAYTSFNVILPNNWIAIGNSLISSQGPYIEATYLNNTPPVINQNLLTAYLAGKGGDYYAFSQTRLLPTYLFCIAAGEYYSVALTPAEQYNNIPMTLYSLSSYKTSLDYCAPFIFSLNKLALQTYQTKLNVPYAFDKYDIVFCHEYLAGAMQNPGIITFDDKDLYDESASAQQIMYFGYVLAHECVHNWFGNYVTMKWWDDLWLNQSFASMLAYYFLQTLANKSNPNIPNFSSAWAIGLKYMAGGYHQDQMISTTHPLRVEVANTNVASSIFDQISYRKGQGVLKQLLYLMEDANFFSSLQNYLKKNPWKNTTTDQLLQQFDALFPTKYTFTFSEWAQTWLLQPSLNILTASWDPTSTSTTANLTINQSDYDQTGTYKQLRYHFIKVTFYQSDGTQTTQQVLVNNTSETIVTYDASKGISAILLNSAHDDFVKVRFDPDSLAFFKTGVNKVGDIMARMVIYFYLAQQVRDGLITVNDYVAFALQNIANQPQDIVFNSVFRLLDQATSSYIPSTVRGDVRSNIFTFLLGQLTLLNSKLQQKNSVIKHLQLTKEKYLKQSFKKFKEINQQIKKLQEPKLVLTDLLPTFCQSQDQIDILEKWRTNTYTPLSNIPISIGQGWEVIKLVYTSSRYTSSQRFGKYVEQKALDNGTYAQLALNTCLSLEATQNTLDTIYLQFKRQEQSFTVKESLAEGWNSSVHIDLLQTKFKDEFFNDLPDLSVLLRRNHFQFFYNELKPIDDNLSDTINRFQQINLLGSDLMGNMINIKRIIEIYLVRQKLYLLNSAQK